MNIVRALNQKNKTNQKITMAKTPEGQVKDLTKKLLAAYNIQPAKDVGNDKLTWDGYYYMPSQAGRGVVRGIPDFMGIYLGQAFGVEAKAPGKEPTKLQELNIARIRSAGGAVFVVDGESSLLQVEQWLKDHSRRKG